MTPHGTIGARAHELVLGVPGSGKTTIARARVRDARAARVVYFDPTGDYSEEGERFAAADLDQAALAGRYLRAVVVPGADVPGDFERTVTACRAAAELGGLVLVADEVGDYSRACDATLTRLHRNGHHDGVASILVSQCAVDVPKTCRRTASRVTSLLQTAADDLAELEREYGPEFAARVRAWRPNHPPVVWASPTLA